MNNKIKLTLMIGIIFLSIIGFIFGLKYMNREVYITDHEYLYDIAIQYLIDNDDDLYKNKEDYQLFLSYEGFGITAKDDNKYAYMWILEETYYVENDVLEKGSGSSMFYRFTFKDNGVIKYELPRDGNEYTKSIKELCPNRSMINKVLNYDLNLSNDRDIKEHYSYLYPFNIENISTEIYDVSSIGATIIITDKNESLYTYGEWYKIEKEENGKWIEVKTKINDYAFTDIGYLVDNNNEVRFVISWEWLYGELSPGNYRIVKEVNNQYIYIPFVLA